MKRTVSHSYLEGKRALDAALSAGVPLQKIYLDEALNKKESWHERLLRRVPDVPVVYVSKKQLSKMSKRGAHQGVIAQIKPYDYMPFESLLARVRPKDLALIVVLDHITDEGNLGAIIRSAEVMGASGVVIPSARSAEVGPGAYKTSAGAVFTLPVVRVTNIATALEHLKDAGFWICAATEHAQQLLWDAPLNGKLVLVMGAEDSGISDLVRKRSDFEVAIPQLGTLESLNVAQAATVLMYEWVRQIRHTS